MFLKFGQSVSLEKMKSSSCFRRLKDLTISVNLLLLAFGVIVMSIGLCHKYVCFSNHWYLQILEESRQFFNITLLRVSAAMLGVGAQMILLGILGMYGTWHNSLCILGLSLTFLVVLLVEEIIVIMWPPAYHHAIKLATETVVMKEYAENITLIVNRFDAIQRKLECCGSISPLDWSHSAFTYQSTNESTLSNDVNVVSENSRQNFELPISCCRNSSDELCLEYVAGVHGDNIDEDII